MTSKTIRDAAKEYIPLQTRNISELQSVSTDLLILDGEGTNKETGETFIYKYIEVNDDEYRIPGKVLGDLKAILEKKPNLKNFSVTRKGQGMTTQYTVIPLD